MQIKNGVVTKLNGIKIIQHLIPVSNTFARPQYPMNPEYITIHNTGNPGASALANSIYVDSVKSYTSWHFTVGPNEVYQELPITESAWHAGDGNNGTGNRKSIGIEISEVSGAEETSIKFVAELLKATGITIDKVVPHQRWSGKYCPRLILPHWDSYIKSIENYYKEITKPAHWGQTHLDSLTKKGFISTPEAWNDFDEPVNKAQILALIDKITK